MKGKENKEKTEQNNAFRKFLRLPCKNFHFPFQRSFLCFSFLVFIFILRTFPENNYGLSFLIKLCEVILNEPMHKQVASPSMD